MHRRLLKDEGTELLLGNEAIARGLIEAGAGIAATYPGTPSSEVGGALERIAEEAGMYFEYSVNEKVAFDVAAAAAVAGARSFVFMKHVGLNVASDAFMSLAYTGVRGGMVVMTADDPSCHSSQNEQDNRYYARASLLPMLEPSTPAECKDMVIEAFRVSEELGAPVVLRTTTRVNHARGAVTFGPRLPVRRQGEFVRDPKRFVTVPANARLGRLEQLRRLDAALRLSESSGLNKADAGEGTGVITSGVAWTYVKEWSSAPVLKLGFTHPVPEALVREFISSRRRVVVVEELEPFLEDEVRRIAQESSINVEIIGKRTGHLPRYFEYSPDTVLGLKGVLDVEDAPRPLKADLASPSRPPVLCAGCPHRSAFYAVRKAVGKEGAIYSGDIGCYTLGVQPPMECMDLVLSMGSSVGGAAGFSKSTSRRVVAFIGDSTFFHGGIPGLINAAYNRHKFTLMILDNRTTAMTGHQPNPGTGRQYSSVTSPGLPLEPLVRACGVESVSVVDSYDIKAMTEAVRASFANDGVSVIIADRACPLALRKEGKLVKTPLAVNQARCVKCYACAELFSCPSIARRGREVHIDAGTCIGCGGCAQVCPRKAIGPLEAVQ